MAVQLYARALHTKFNKPWSAPSRRVTYDSIFTVTNVATEIIKCSLVGHKGGREGSESCRIVGG